MKTKKSTSHLSKQLLGKIGQLRTKSPISPKLLKMPFQDKKHTLTVWTDLEKAFDKVWKECLKLKLRQCGVAGRMFKWIGQYMHNRKAKVQAKQHLSKKRTLRQGVPQGGVLSPTLFLIFIRDVLHRMPKSIQGAVYADDLALSHQLQN